MNDIKQIISKFRKTPKFLGVLIAIFWFALWTRAFNWPSLGCTPGSCNLPLVQDFVNQRVGVATTSPQVALDVNGAVRIGQLTTEDINAITCDATKLGTIVFDKDNDLIKICNENWWSRLSDNSAPSWWDFTMPANTESANVELTITCPSDPENSTPIEMYVSWDIIENSEWENCTSSKNVTLVSWNGIKTVSIKWRDSFGNETSTVSKNVTLWENLFSKHGPFTSNVYGANTHLVVKKYPTGSYGTFSSSEYADICSHYWLSTLNSETYTNSGNSFNKWIHADDTYISAAKSTWSSEWVDLDSVNGIVYHVWVNSSQFTSCTAWYNPSEGGCGVSKFSTASCGSSWYGYCRSPSVNWNYEWAVAFCK